MKVSIGIYIVIYNISCSLSTQLSHAHGLNGAEMITDRRNISKR